MTTPTTTTPALATFRCPNCHRTTRAIAGPRTAAWCDRTMCRVRGWARKMEEVKGART